MPSGENRGLIALAFNQRRRPAGASRAYSGWYRRHFFGLLVRGRAVRLHQNLRCAARSSHGAYRCTRRLLRFAEFGQWFVDIAEMNFEEFAARAEVLNYLIDVFAQCRTALSPTADAETEAEIGDVGQV